MVVRVNIKEPIGRRTPPWWKRMTNRWSILFWLLAIVLAVFLYLHGGRMGGMTGTVGADRQEVAPLETSRLQTLYVEEGQDVNEGDLLAIMDASVLDAEMALAKLQAERQFALSVTEVKEGLRDARLRYAETLGELEVLNAEVERLEGLLQKKLVDAETVAQNRARQQALQQAVELYPEMIEEMKSDLEVARARSVVMDLSFGEAPVSGGASPPMDEGVLGFEVSRSQFGLLRLRKESYSLYAHQDGTVSRVYHRPGDVVPGGEPVLTVVGKKARNVVGFLPEANARDVEVGMTAYVTSASDPGPVVPARVVAITPEILTLPTRISPVPNRILRGRRVIMIPEGEHNLFPGESVTIRFGRPFFSMLFSSSRSAAPSRDAEPNLAGTTE